jgi:hypothetical protein
VEQPLFHVVLQGRQVGPYDRRTIVGMRIKKALTSDHVLIDSGGARLTVADLIGRRPRSNDFHPNRTGAFSIVQATYPASLLGVQGKGRAIPRFSGEVEVRVQTEVLRIAGRHRKLLGWKEDRVKLPLGDIVHARVKGSHLDLWLRSAKSPELQRLALELFTPEAAGELADWLPAATPWPEATGSGPASLPAALPAADHRVLWVSVASVAVVLGVVIAVLMSRRVY